MMKKEFVFLRLFILVLYLIGFCVCDNEKEDENRDTEQLNEAEAEDPIGLAVESYDKVGNCTRRRPNSLVHEIKCAEEGQFPFVAAVMSDRNDYLCCGTIIAPGMVLTTATCLSQPLSFVLINTTKATTTQTAIVLHAIRSEMFPTFQGADTTKDVGIIYVEKPNITDDEFMTKIVRISNYTNARPLVDVEAVGFGLNAEVRLVRDLQYVGMEHRPIYDVGDIMQAFIDCIDTKVSTCFKDTGSPLIFDNELVGIVTKGEMSCTKEMTSVFALNKRMVDFLPTFAFKKWLDERIKVNAEQIQKASASATPEVPPAYRRFGQKKATMETTSVKAIPKTYSSSVVVKPVYQIVFAAYCFVCLAGV